MNSKAMLLFISIFVSINSFTFAMEGSSSSSGEEVSSEQEEMSLIEALPPEMLSEIFDYLPINQLADSRTISRKIDEVICVGTRFREILKVKHLKNLKNSFCKKAGKPGILTNLTNKRIQYLIGAAKQFVELPLSTRGSPSFSADKRARVLLNAYYFLIKHGSQDKRVILAYKHKFHTIYQSASANIQSAFQHFDEELNFFSGTVKNLKNQLKDK